MRVHTSGVYSLSCGARGSTGMYTRVYGDNDQLPSGNLLGSFWVSNYTVAQWDDRTYGDEQFDARVVEARGRVQQPRDTGGDGSARQAAHAATGQPVLLGVLQHKVLLRDGRLCGLEP